MTMMRPFTCLFFLSLFFLLFHTKHSLVIGAASHRHASLVPEVCASAAKDPNVNYSFCVESLQAVPKSRTAGVKDLAVVAAKLAKANATRTKSYVKKLLKTKVKDLYLKNCLEDCLELYSDAIPMIKDSVKAIKAGRYDDANIWLSSVFDAADTCEQGFRDKKGLKDDPLKKRNQDLSQLIAIGLSITNSLS